MESLLADPKFTNKSLRNVAMNTFGAILYRTGYYREAIDRVNEAITVLDGMATVDDGLILAMAHHKAGDDAKAREWLGMLPPDAAEISSGGEFWFGEAFRLIWREAERMILDPIFPADPFAP
jgi:hypothetical protein